MKSGTKTNIINIQILQIVMFKISKSTSAKCLLFQK
jgi:hypothetical protein